MKGNRKMKCFAFAINYNPVTKLDEEFVTEFKIPAKDFDEAKKKLECLVGKVMTKKCFLNDEYDY